MVNKFIQIGGRRMSAGELEKEVRKQSEIEIQRRMLATGNVIKKELELIIKELEAHSSKNNAAFREAMGGRPIRPPAAQDMYVKFTVSGGRLNIQVLSASKGADNAFNKMDAGTEPRTVPPGKAVVFPRYEGNIIDEGVRRPITISSSAVRYGEDAVPKHTSKQPLVMLFGANKKYKKGYLIRGIKPKNLYARVIASLKRANKYVVSGSGKDISLIVRSSRDDVARFSPDALRIKVRIS